MRNQQKDIKIYEKKPLYEFQPLPKLETLFYSVSVFTTFVYVCSQAYIGSARYQWESTDALSEYKRLPYFGIRRKDTTNYEWRSWTPYFWKIIPWFVGHSLLFNVSAKILPSDKFWKLFMFVYWITACVSIYGAPLVGIAVAVGILLFCCMRISRSRLVIWLLSGSVLAGLHLVNLDDVHAQFNDYIIAGFLVYKLVQYISYCLEECDNGRPENRKFFNGLYNMFWYAFYLPYLNSLIVTYKRFSAQIMDQKMKQQNWRHVLFFALRISFWFAFLEFALHFIYVDAMCTDAKYMSSVDTDVLLTMGYMTGQIYQIIYVIMFSIPAAFARADNMQPPEGPICISRVTLYSKMWRCFDRGFYDFFKEYIFLPICRPTFSPIRKIAGVLLSYFFVLLWHGLAHNYIVWVVLNIVELFIETVAKIVYTIPSVRRWRETHLSDNCFRRIVAFLICCPWAIGCYAAYYFLMESHVAYIFVERIFWEHTVNFHWQFVFLVFMGYMQSQVCIDIDIWMRNKEKKHKAC